MTNVHSFPKQNFCGQDENVPLTIVLNVKVVHAVFSPKTSTIAQTQGKKHSNPGYLSKVLAALLGILSLKSLQTTIRTMHRKLQTNEDRKVVEVFSGFP